MCGIIGFSGESNCDLQKIQTLMLWNGFERGKDATGIYSKKNNLIKDNKFVGEFLINNKNLKEDNVFIAHVRAKTVGQNTKDNAHPFEEDNVVLLHNGTLTNHYALSRKYDFEYNSYEVDSHLICKIINKEKNFKVLSEIDGGAAFIIINKENPNIIYVFRNDKRTLFKGTLDGGIYISSLSEPLNLIGCNNIKEFKADYLYTIEKGLIKGAPIKIVNKPVTYQYQSYNPNKLTIYNEPKLAIGCRLRCDNQNIHNYVKDGGVTVNKYYLIKDVVKTDFIITDNFGKEIEVGKFSFDTNKDYFTKGDYIKALVNLNKSSNKSNTPDISKGSFLLVDKDYLNGECRVLNLINNEYYRVQKSNFILCNDSEIKEIEGKDPNQQEFDFSLSDNTNFLNDNYYPFEEDVDFEEINNQQDEDTPKDNDEEDDEYYNIQLNKELLLEDFEDIKSSVEELYPYLTNHPDTHLIKQEIEDKIDECIKLYSLVEENADLTTYNSN